MLISQLPTARLRARAFELSGGKDKELDEAFLFDRTSEGHRFWGAVFEQEWFTAMSMQPQLFELDTYEVDESVEMLEGALNARS